MREALAAHPRELAVVYIADTVPRQALAEVLTAAQSAKVTVETRPAEVLDALARGVRHQGVIAVAGGDYAYVDLPTLLTRSRGQSTPALIVALDEITDPHNLGAIVRSSVALGAHGVVTLKDRAAPVNSTVVRASAGATEHASIARVTNLARALETLRAEGHRVVGLDAEGQCALDEVDVTGPVTLVVGSEGKGLRRLVREGCDVLAKIPLAGPVASLNASVAAAVALYEVSRQRRVRTGGE